MGDERSTMGDEFRLRRRVQFSETDVAGIVHFSNFFRYFEDAEHALWRQAGLSIHAPDAPVGWPRVAAACTYHKALRFEDEFDIVVRISDIGRRTISYSGEILCAGERCASGTWKIASVVKRPDGSMRSTEIPATVAERLEPFAHRSSSIVHRPSERS
jgi:YbgC/YbaW family acyl-CoA thioester hydrolase